MEDTPQKVFLLIADISGYTKFMVSKRKTLAHAQAIITELMEAIIAEIMESRTSYDAEVINDRLPHFLSSTHYGGSKWLALFAIVLDIQMKKS